MKFGYTIIYVQDVEATLRFYEEAFDCKQRFLHDSKCYGELETNSTILAFAREDFALSNVDTFEKNRKQAKPAGFEIGFVTENVLMAYENALKAGAQSLKAPVTKPWGQEVAYVRDINGIIVELCSALI